MGGAVLLFPPVGLHGINRTKIFLSPVLADRQKKVGNARIT
jgi:hypothetical protein